MISMHCANILLQEAVIYQEACTRMSLSRFYGAGTLLESCMNTPLTCILQDQTAFLRKAYICMLNQSGSHDTVSKAVEWTKSYATLRLVGTAI